MHLLIVTMYHGLHESGHIFTVALEGKGEEVCSGTAGRGPSSGLPRKAVDN